MSVPWDPEPLTVVVPYHAELFMFVLGFSVGGLGVIILMVRTRLTCMLCGKKHPPRPENMTAVEYVKFYCDGKRWDPRDPGNTDVRGLGKLSFFRKRRILDDGPDSV